MWLWLWSAVMHSYVVSLLCVDNAHNHSVTQEEAQLCLLVSQLKPPPFGRTGCWLVLCFRRQPLERVLIGWEQVFAQTRCKSRAVPVKGWRQDRRWPFICSGKDIEVVMMKALTYFEIQSDTLSFFPSNVCPFPSTFSMSGSLFCWALKTTEPISSLPLTSTLYGGRIKHIWKRRGHVCTDLNVSRLVGVVWQISTGRRAHRNPLLGRKQEESRRLIVKVSERRLWTHRWCFRGTPNTVRRIILVVVHDKVWRHAQRTYLFSSAVTLVWLTELLEKWSLTARC